jgi:hypothetical protein
MTTLKARSEVETVAPLPVGDDHESWFDRQRCSSDELFRWARFLDQAEAVVVGRHRAVAALLEAARNDRELLSAARLHAVEAVREGVGVLSTVRLLDAALDEVCGHGHWGVGETPRRCSDSA